MSLIVFPFYLILGRSHKVDILFTPSFPVSVITSYGFKEQGKYNLTIRSKLAPYSLMFLSKDGYRERMYTYDCNNKEQFMKNFNTSIDIDNETMALQGEVPSDGVYKLYLVVCSSKQSSYAIVGTFSNPDTQLDTRNRYLPYLFMQSSIFYIGIFVYWFAKTYHLQFFHYPLHISFMILQLVRSINLFVWYYTWTILSRTDKIPFILDFLSHFFDVIYYSMLISCLLFLCSGCNIFRIKFSLEEHLKITVPSLIVTTGIVSIPLLRIERYLMILFSVVIIGLIIYVSIGITSMIKAHRIIALVTEKPSLLDKIKKSREVVSFAYTLLVITLTIYIILYLSGIPEFICALIMETGCFLCTAGLLSFYTQVPQRPTTTTFKYLNVMPAVLHSPCGTENVLITYSKQNNSVAESN